MIEDIYHQALARLRSVLDQAGAAYTDEEGELTVGPHRLGLAIAFDGFVPQGKQFLAPLDLRLHIDNCGEDLFRVGTLGIGPQHASAVAAALDEWLSLTAVPVLRALGALPTQGAYLAVQSPLASWRIFPGHASARGEVPAALRPGGSLFKQVVDVVQRAAHAWQPPRTAPLKSAMLVVAQGDEGFELQAAVDGIIDTPLQTALGELAWPRTIEPYVFKQFFAVVGKPR